MLPQIACPRWCIVTLVAFVWLFPTVHFQMPPQSACIRRWIFTLVTFIWMFSIVNFHPLAFNCIITFEILIHYNYENCGFCCNTCCKLIKILSPNWYWSWAGKIRKWNSCLRKHRIIYKNRHYFFLAFMSFLAVQNSSIGDLVTHSLTHSLTDWGYFYFWHREAVP